MQLSAQRPQPSQASLLERLDRATADVQRSVEAAWIAPLEHPSRETYRYYLTTIYGFHVALEPALVRAAVDIRFLDPRIRSGRIALDLLALGIGTQEQGWLARQFPIPAFDQIEALGWLYVAEHSMLRAHQLHDRLTRTIPAEMARASRYLTTYAGVVDQRWKELGVVLDEVGSVGRRADRIVDAAFTALAVQSEWLEDRATDRDNEDTIIVSMAS